jgi:hypothetical protein
MPWHISNNAKGCDGYAVVKDDTGEVVGCHDSEGSAKDQLAALYASEANKNLSGWSGAFFPQTN